MHILYPIFVLVVGAWSVLSVATLLLLLAAAASARRQSAFPAALSPTLRLAVIIPAHNEEMTLGGALDSLRRQDYPTDLYEVIVVADNCEDRTAEIARASGAAVLERRCADQRGKGYALNYALDNLLARPIPFDGFVIIDADTWADPGFLNAIGSRLASGQDWRGYAAWQGRYGVLNANEGWRAALMAGAFDLVNHVKPLGRDRLNLSVGLKGNGMAFSRALAAETRWNGGSLTEDLDFGLDLARRFGLRVGYAPEARVLAQMPTSGTQAASQRTRWESGRGRLVSERALPLLWEGLRRRSLLLWDCGWDLLLPPLAELAGLLSVWLVLIAIGALTHLLTQILFWIVAAVMTTLGLLAYILGGLRLSGASRDAYLALLYAPFYALWKLVLLGGKLSRKRPLSPTPASEEWVRTTRAPLTAPPEPKLTDARPK